MIITEQKPLAEVLTLLKDYQKIFLVGCGECATTCNTGGKKQVEQMRSLLEEQGKTIVGTCIPDAPCIASQIKSEFAKQMQALRQAQAILVLACGLGVQSVKDNQRLAHPVFPACNTLCSAVMDSQGNFLEKCSSCAECVLGLTSGICPLTLCPKGLLNGPCGGMDKGKCEVDKDKDCAWVLIYQAQEKNKQLDVFKKIQQPKDFSKSLKPRKISLQA